MSFLNRVDAGRQLAATLRAQHLVQPILVGLTRGGVPVAAEIARELRMPLDICVVRKLVARGDPSVTIGAVAEHGAHHLNQARIAAWQHPQADLQRLLAHELAEVTRIGALLRDGRPLDLHGHDVILVDDGVVTGSTIRAALGALRARGGRRIELAVPVGNAGALAALRPEFEHILCLASDPMLVAIGARYSRLMPVSDAEIVGLLAAFRPAPGEVVAMPARI